MNEFLNIIDSYIPTAPLYVKMIIAISIIMWSVFFYVMGYMECRRRVLEITKYPGRIQPRLLIDWVNEELNARRKNEPESY